MTKRQASLITALFFLVSCHAARPRRFADLRVVPAPRIELPPGRLNPLANKAAIDRLIVDRYDQAFIYERGMHGPGGESFNSAGLFCSTPCPYSEFLSLTTTAQPADPATPTVINSLYLRSTERAQAEFVRQTFARLPASTKAADAIQILSKALGDQKKPVDKESPLTPRVQITMSHLLTLPGEWERVQYLAVFFVLHSEDVVFSNTNDFENVLRDIDLGHLTQTAVNAVSAPLSVGFGNAPPAGTALPSTAGITPTLSYTEALDRTLKEQLQFRASSIERFGRVFVTVLKSSQQNKIPTLIRSVVTLQYRDDHSGVGLVLSPTYKGDELDSIAFTDQVIRKPELMSDSDKPANSGRYLTQATPVMVAVVRRVRNAKGINTSLEDDDKVDYVTQAKVLEPITLDASPRCEYTLRAADLYNKPIGVRVLAPGAPDGKPVLFTSEEEGERFTRFVLHRLGGKAAKADGLAWGAEAPDLEGYRLVWGYDTDRLEMNRMDWTQVNLRSLKLRRLCGQ